MNTCKPRPSHIDIQADLVRPQPLAQERLDDDWGRVRIGRLVGLGRLPQHQRLDVRQVLFDHHLGLGAR